MTAAERQLPSPPASVSWIDLAKNIFDTQAARWDTATCGGGLPWQIFTFNRGYDYKNSASAGAFLQLAARLARYTENQTYADWANKTWDWTTSVGLISSEFKVYDGAPTTENCSSIDRLEWTYTAGAFLYGSAAMYNFVRRTLSNVVTQQVLTKRRPKATVNGRTVRKAYFLQCRFSSPTMMS